MTKANQREIWKTYPKFPFIEVSNLGRVRTKDRYVPSKNGSKRLIKGRILKQQLDHGGYLYVSLSVNGKQVKLKVHRIVATCFIPNPNDYPEINHIDNDPTNNVVSNLEWCTHKQNIAYKEKFGVSAKDAAKASRKALIAVNPETAEVFLFESQNEAARQLGIRQGSINHVVEGERNKAGDYWFCNADENAVEKARSKFDDDIAKKVEELIGENYD